MIEILWDDPELKIAAIGFVLWCAFFIIASIHYAKKQEKVKA